MYAFSRRFYPKRLTLHSSYSFTFYQLLLSLGIEPMILALLAPCSTIWATGKLCFYTACAANMIDTSNHVVFWGEECYYHCHRTGPHYKTHAWSDLILNTMENSYFISEKQNWIYSIKAKPDMKVSLCVCQLKSMHIHFLCSYTPVIKSTLFIKT